MSHDFGRVTRGAKLTTRFQFSNVGKGPLVVHGVHASCGCTAAETTKGREYAPGDSGSIEVTFDSTDFAGRVSKTVTVMTNEKNLPDRTLTVLATVVAEFEANPPMVDFGEVASTDGAARTIVIKTLPGAPQFRVEKLNFNTNILDVSHRIEGGLVYLDVKLKKDAPAGFVRETIRVANNSRTLRELPVPVRGTIRGNIELAPRYVEFGAIAPSDKSTRTIVLKAQKDFEVLAIKPELNINGSRIEDASQLVKVNASNTDKQKRQVSIDLINAAGQAGSVHGKLVMDTSDPQQKQVVVDFYAFFR